MRVLFVSLALLVGPAVTSAGCGVIKGYGQPQPVHVTSTPPGATVRLDGVAQEGETPLTLRLEPGSVHVLDVSYEGRQAGVVVNRRVRTEVLVWDAALTLGIGLLVDHLAGGLYALDETVHARLPEPRPRTCSFCGERRPPGVSPCPECGMD